MAAAFSNNKNNNSTTTTFNYPRPKSMMIPRGQERAYQPLTADSVQGIQDRYRAVEEMEWLVPSLDSTVGDTSLDHGTIYSLLKDATYRNRKGYVKSLGSPPLQGFTFALEPMLDAVEQKGQVLEGPELLEISIMLDIMEDVTCWHRGLLQQKQTTMSLSSSSSFSDGGGEQCLFIELPKLAECIVVNSTLQELLRNAFDDKEVTKLSGTTFPTIGQLRAKVKTLRADVLQKLQDLIQLPSFQPKLALESGGPAYSEINGRLVVPLNPKFANSIGIVHDMSRSGRTAYVEPTPIVGPTNELRQAEVELQAEEARIWRYLTNQVMDQRPTLEASAQALGQLDLVMARLLLGRQLKGVIPTVQDEGVISLRNARHPVLLLRKLQNVIGSDIDLGANGNQGLVLTGPNAGGKTGTENFDTCIYMPNKFDFRAHFFVVCHCFTR
jgi:DNA mismatch repair protein MutS2